MKRRALSSVLAPPLLVVLAALPATAGQLTWGPNGETVFEHTKASLRDPHFGMRFFLGTPPQGTLANVADPLAPNADAVAEQEALSDANLMWDVAFGERIPIVGYVVPRDEQPRWSSGVQLNLDAAAFMLLDFSAQSSATINTDYLIGGSVDARPWSGTNLDHFSVMLGIHHLSSHLGDEYVLSAATVQSQRPPQVNSRLHYRANPSYTAFHTTVSADWIWRNNGNAISGRLYVGGRVFLDSTIEAANRPEQRVGFELALDPGSREIAVRDSAQKEYRKGRFSFQLAYELLFQRAFQLYPDPHPNVPVEARFIKLDKTWVTHQARLWATYNFDQGHSKSRGLEAGFRYVDGRNQHGQLIEYDSVRQLGVDVAYFW